MASPASDDRPFPPGEYPVIVIGSGPGGAPGLVRPPPLRHRARRPVRRPGRGRHVPQVAVLPAAALVDQALRARGADRARVPAVRLEQPRDLRARAAVDADRRSWTARPTSRRGPRCSPTSRRSRSGPGSPSATSARGSPRRRSTARTARRSCSRPRTASTARGCSCSRSASPSRGARRRQGSSTPATTPTRATRRGYAGKRIFIIGKQNSGFELATGRSRPGRLRSRCARRRPPRRRSRSGRWPGSGPATCSRSRTTTSGWGSRSSTRRSPRSSPSTGGLRVDIKRTDTARS